MSDVITHVTDASFNDDVLSAEIPVLVDFWAAWCGPCKMIAPVLDQLAEKYDGKLKVWKMDVDGEHRAGITLKAKYISIFSRAKPYSYSSILIYPNIF